MRLFMFKKFFYELDTLSCSPNFKLYFVREIDFSTRNKFHQKFYLTDENFNKKIDLFDSRAYTVDTLQRHFRSFFESNYFYTVPEGDSAFVHLHIIRQEITYW